MPRENVRFSMRTSLFFLIRLGKKKSSVFGDVEMIVCESRGQLNQRGAIHDARDFLRGFYFFCSLLFLTKILSSVYLVLRNMILSTSLSSVSFEMIYKTLLSTLILNDIK